MADESGASQPQLSVIITTHNRHHEAQRAITSAQCQTLDGIEVIVVDDGSTPPFVSSDSELRVIRIDPARGVCAARNAGLVVARGDWVTFLDDDDQLSPWMAETSIQAAISSDLPAPVAVLSGMEVVDENGNLLDVRLPVNLPKGSHYFLEDRQPGRSFQTHNTLVAPLEVVRGIGGWDEQMKASEHDDFFVRLNEVCSIQGVEQTTYRHTDHAGPRLHSDLLARPEAMRRTMEKHRDTFQQHRARYAHYLATMGATYLRAGAWWPALRATSRALMVGPLRLQHVIWWLGSLLGPKGLALMRWLRTRLASFYRRVGSIQKGGET